MVKSPSGNKSCSGSHWPLQDLCQPGTATLEQGEFGGGGRTLSQEGGDAGLRVMNLRDRDDLPVFGYGLEHAFFAQHLEETIRAVVDAGCGCRGGRAISAVEKRRPGSKTSPRSRRADTT